MDCINSMWTNVEFSQPFFKISNVVSCSIANKGRNFFWIAERLAIQGNLSLGGAEGPEDI